MSLKNTVHQRFTLLLACFALSVAFGSAASAQNESGGSSSTSISDLPIAVQMYTLRDYAETFEEQLAFAAEAGYTQIETVGSHDLSAQEMNALLEQYDVRVVSTHVGLEDLVFGMDALIAFNKAIGNDTIVLPSLSPDPTDAAGWQAAGRTLNDFGARLREAGMTFVFHNHDDEMVEVDGKLALDWLLEAANPDNLKWQADVAWIDRGGQDPVALLERYSGRVVSIHAKDNYPEGEGEDEGGFASVGAGTLEWAEVLPAAAEAGVQQYIVEHDSPVDYQTIAESFDFLNAELPGVLDQ